MESSEGVIGILCSLYFMYVSKNWMWLLVTAFILQILGTLGSFAFPESPRWLIKKGQIQRA